MKRKFDIVFKSGIACLVFLFIWCAWAEVNLGEASFDKPVQLTSK